MKACVIQPKYSLDYSQSEERFRWETEALDRCDESMDLIVMPESCDIPAYAGNRKEREKSVERYNKPLLEQYVIFLRRSLIGQDWGVSEVLYLGQDVWGKFIEKMPATVIVNAYTMLISVPLGLLLGIYAALKKNKWQDKLQICSPVHLRRA